MNEKNYLEKDAMYMNISIDVKRMKGFMYVMRFIESANLYELAAIQEEIRCVHDNIFVFNVNTKSLDKVNCVCMNGGSIQLNVEVL